ncbi:restriction endonuclease subunit S, partial [Limosilactobacillus reuteri]|uniref:restriction endonuclease subunit S n=1 Tax=Limosilactobacillus reuteri TaxID=1598 RepID=UPI003CFE5D4E
MDKKPEKLVPEVRFKGFTDDWEQHKLGDIAKVTKLAGFEFTKYINYSSKGKILAIRGLNIKDGKFNLQDVKYIDNSDFNKLTRSKLRQDDILFTYVGTIGNSAIVPAGVKWYLAPNVCLIRTQTENAKFISHLIQSDKFQHQEIPKWITTSSQPALSMENIRKFSIILPTISEQLKISNLVSIIDTIITLQQRKLEILIKLKRSFLTKSMANSLDKNPELYFNSASVKWLKQKLSDLTIKEFKGNTKLNDTKPGKTEYLDAERLNGNVPLFIDKPINTLKSDILILWDGSKAGSVYYGFEGSLGSTLKAIRLNPKLVNSFFVYQQLKSKQDVIF